MRICNLCALVFGHQERRPHVQKQLVRPAATTAGGSLSVPLSPCTRANTSVSHASSVGLNFRRAELCKTAANVQILPVLYFAA